MSLNFSFADVADYEEVTTDPNYPNGSRWHPVANELVWLSLICGFDRITKANHAKVAARIAGYQQIYGACVKMRHGSHGNSRVEDVYITPADVERFIGMRTNASTMTDAEWRKKVYRMVMDNPDAARQQHSALAKLGTNTPKKPVEPAGKGVGVLTAATAAAAKAE